MKISQVNDYKKPLYAIGAAAVIVASSVTGCTPGIGYAGGMTVEESTAALEGDVSICEYTIKDADNKIDPDKPSATDDEISIAGEVAVDQEGG